MYTAVCAIVAHVGVLFRSVLSIALCDLLRCYWLSCVHFSTGCLLDTLIMFYRYFARESVTFCSLLVVC